MQETWVCKCGHSNPISRGICSECERVRFDTRVQPKVIGDGHTEEIQMQRDHGLDPIE